MGSAQGRGEFRDIGIGDLRRNGKRLGQMFHTMLLQCRRREISQIPG
jgi:hypothetical protein